MPMDPFFSPDWNAACSQPAFPCENTCPWSQSNHFNDACSARIHPDCLQIASDRLVRVGLSLPARDWFAALAGMGDLLQVTRNPIATLGQVGSFPEIIDWRNPVLPRDALNTFTPNLAEYAHVWAIRENSPAGVAYGFESTDLLGHPFHRAYLTTSAQCEWFQSFVISHQSPPMEAGHWAAPNHVASRQRCHSITNRATFLRSCHIQNTGDANPLSLAVIPHFLATLAHAQLPVRTAQYHRALIHALVWTPTALEANPCEKSPIEFLHGDGVGLQVNLAAIQNAWLWRGRCSCCEQQHWAVELIDAHDHVALAFTAGAPLLEPKWRDLLNACLP